MKLVKFMGLAVLGQEAPLSTWGGGSGVLKGLPTRVCPLSGVLGFLWAEPLCPRPHPHPFGRHARHLRLTSARHPAHLSQGYSETICDREETRGSPVHTMGNKKHTHIYACAHM